MYSIYAFIQRINSYSVVFEDRTLFASRFWFDFNAFTIYICASLAQFCMRGSWENGNAKFLLYNRKIGG